MCVCRISPAGPLRRLLRRISSCSRSRVKRFSSIVAVRDPRLTSSD
jgi:hypothetical protein